MGVCGSKTNENVHACDNFQQQSKEQRLTQQPQTQQQCIQLPQQTSPQHQKQQPCSAVNAKTENVSSPATATTVVGKSHVSPNDEAATSYQYTLTESEIRLDDADDSVPQSLDSTAMQLTAGKMPVQLAPVDANLDPRLFKIELAYNNFKELVQKSYANQPTDRLPNEYAIQQADYTACQLNGDELVHACREIIDAYSVTKTNYDRMFLGRRELVDVHVYRRSTTEEELKLLDRVTQICAEVEHEFSGHLWGLAYAYKYPSAEARNAFEYNNEHNMMMHTIYGL